MNRKDDRSEGYHDHGFHRRVLEHETGRKKNMLEQRPTQATAAIHITMHGERRITLSLSLFNTHPCMKHTPTQLCAYPC